MVEYEWWRSAVHSEPAIHPLRELVQTANHVGGQALVNLLGISQVETSHELYKLLLSLGQPGVELFLLSHCGAGLAVIVMSRVQDRVLRQAEHLAPHTGVQGVTQPSVCPGVPSTDTSSAPNLTMSPSPT